MNKLDLPRITDIRENNGILYFTASQTNVSVINSIRRTILSDIPVVCIKTEPHNEVNETLESTIIYKNTTSLTNEIIKQRLGCVPVHIKNPENIENLVLELDITNKSDGIQYITTGDFKIKEMTTGQYLKEENVHKIFPPNKMTKDFILINRLKPKISKMQDGETLKFMSKFHINTSKMNSQCNVCSTIGYENTIDESKGLKAWNAYKDEIEKTVSDKQLDDIEKNWYNHNIKRYFIKNSFNFILETIGIYTNEELIKLSCQILSNRFNDLRTLIQNDSLKIIPDTINTKNSYDIVLPNISYTIGKVLEYLIHDNYFDKNKTFSYVGFIKKHPHDDDSIIRIVFNKSENSNIDNIKTILLSCIDYSDMIYKHIDESFI